jgi:DNA-binding Lrp family transcriptional regulator
VTHAIVLIEAERDALATLGGQLADLDGVSAAYSVTGEWDYVAVITLRRHEQLAELVTHGMAALPGVIKTQTMVAFEAFSKHDLESLFSVGGE